MRKLLFLLPVAASALFLTGCDEVSYRERTVVSGGGPAYYGDDADFYYVSSRPYSRSYGQLYLRSGRYYYSRGGTYHVYDRPTHHRSHVRHVDYDRRDWDRGRDRDRDRDRDRRDYERVRYERHDRDRDRDRHDDRRSDVQVRERNVYNVNLNRDAGDRRQVRVEERGGLRTSHRQVEGTQRVRAEHAVQRQVKREGGDKKRDRDRDGDRDRERRVD